MVNSKRSVKLKAALKIGLRSSSINMNDIQATPTTSGTNEGENFFKETIKKFCLEKLMKENNSSTSLETFFFKEEFNIHESNIKELINSNVNKTIERLDKLSSEIVDLTASLEFTQKN